jgi:hypothetical protein
VRKDTGPGKVDVLMRNRVVSPVGVVSVGGMGVQRSACKLMPFIRADVIHY